MKYIEKWNKYQEASTLLFFLVIWKIIGYNG